MAGNPKNSGKAPARGTCDWFGPSYQGVVAVVAISVGRGWVQVMVRPYRVNPGLGVSSAGLAGIS